MALARPTPKPLLSHRRGRRKLSTHGGAHFLDVSHTHDDVADTYNPHLRPEVRFLRLASGASRCHSVQFAVDRCGKPTVAKAFLVGRISF